jgi:polar amino acid transport system permease protein
MTDKPTRTSPLKPRRQIPWWLLAFSLLAATFLTTLLTNELYSEILRRVSAGLQVTITVTLIAYSLALTLGLVVGLARTAAPHSLVYQVATFYVEIVRGIPMLVLLFYIAFVAGPEIVAIINFLGGLLVDVPLLSSLGNQMLEMRVRDLSFTTRAVLALTIGYSAFLSEVFRAGIESVDQGQREAALSLGMNQRQVMRHIVLPQAIRNVLPPLGNDFIAMLKDSSLVSVVGVRDITRVGDAYATGSFRYFEAFNVVAFLYLIMTIVLSLVVRYIERRMQRSRRPE